MSAVVAWVTDHVLRVWEDAENVSVVVLYECPYCQKKHKVGWHSPTSDGGERTAPCTFSAEYLLGRKVRLRWADIPGAVSSALIEFRPDILNSSTDMKEV